MPNTLYMSIGIPASGKTTWSKEWLPNATVISPDLILEEKYGYKWTPAHVADAWNICYQTLGRAMAAEMFRADDAEYLWDACLPTPRDRSALLNIAKGMGWRVIAVYFSTPKEVCVKRNAKRPKHRRVPDKQMDSMWVRLTPPQSAEAWDDTIVVEHEED